MSHFDEVQDKLVAKLKLFKEREEALEKEKKFLEMSENKANITARKQELDEDLSKVKKDKKAGLEQLEGNLNAKLNEVKSQTQQIEADRKNGSFVKKWGEQLETLNDLVSGVEKLRSVAQIAMVIAHPDAGALEQLNKVIYDQQAAVELAGREIRERTDPKNQQQLKSTTQAEVSPDTKKKEAEKLLEDYVKNVRKEAVKADTIEDAIKEADKNLLEKLNGGKLSDGSKLDELKNQIKERHGAEIEKEFEQRRQEEIQKRKELEQKQHQSLELSKQKERER